MASSSRLLKQYWTKEEEAGLIERLVELVNAVGGGSATRRFILDRATGGRVETFTDVGSNDPTGYDAFATDAALDMDFRPMYSQRLNMSPDELMGTRAAGVSKGRYVSSGSKRKRGGQAVDSGDIIRTAIEYENEQLNRIAKWLVLQRQDASQTCQEVVDSWRPSLS
ncbi:retrotransposon protein [Cucumis melo var. makuwa]|uniref:Retrotransposon protein n=2 Tax=Cucumis melo TaxID=3656 RepID=A0A5D3C2D3_CUCMM|nr:retrotransposon protein [Cucumis melo var. makuwa]TYK05520.1 retrotransposon protein [Cucumis melo var. makuwa]